MHGRIWAPGFGLGVLATLGMTILMLLGVATKVSPMPHPIPVAIMAKFLGPAAPMPLLLVLGLTAHFLYGGVWGAVLWTAVPPLTVPKGVGLALLLWVVMLLAWLPFLGWGVFGSAITVKIAVATLVLHLVYGGVLGLGGQVLVTKRQTDVVHA